MSHAVEVGLAAVRAVAQQRATQDAATPDRRVQSIAFVGPDRRLGFDRRLGPRRASDQAPSNIIEAAKLARDRARAEFSDFRVGAAIETTGGRIITGCNIENSTYGLTMCAERVAMFKAISDGHQSFRRIAVVADTSQPRRRAARADRSSGSWPATWRSFSPTFTRSRAATS